MPTFTKFTDRKTGETPTLIELDKILCEDQGIRPDDRTMCGLYDFICFAGIAILAKSGKSEVTAETLEEYISSHPELDPTDISTLKEYLVENYVFTAWYGQR